MSRCSLQCVGWFFGVSFRSGGLGGVGCCLFVGLGLTWCAVAVPVMLGGGEVMVWCVRGLFGLFEILPANRA